MSAGSADRAPHGDASTVFIGDVAIDEYFTADTWPHPGNKAVVQTQATHFGGSIANAARVHARLGGRSEFVSLLNRGELTDRILAELDQAGVRHTHMLFDETVGDQRNLIFLVHGEHVVLTPDVDDRAMPLPEEAMREFASPGFLYTTLRRAQRLRSGTDDAAGTLARLQASGRRLIVDLDVAGVRSPGADLLRRAFVVMVNDRGFEESFPDDRGPERVRRWLLDNEVEALVHTRAGDGAVLYARDRTIAVAGYRVPVIDVTGAGDTLGGALAFGLGSGRDWEAALEFAVAAASRSVMYLGPQGGVAREDDVHRFAAEHEDARTGIRAS